MATVDPVIKSSTNGAFIDSCVIYAWMTGNTSVYKSKVVDCA